MKTAYEILNDKYTETLSELHFLEFKMADDAKEYKALEKKVDNLRYELLNVKEEEPYFDEKDKNEKNDYLELC